MRRVFLAFGLAAGALALPASGDEPAADFSTPKARDAQKTYQKTLERLKADYDARVKKAQAEYLKSLESALADAKKSKNAGEAARISKAVDELRKQTGSPAQAPQGPQRSEKGPGGVSFIGGNGESIEQAVFIKGAGDSAGAVEAEGHWLKRRYPTWKKLAQALTGGDGKKFDEIKIRSPEGAVKTIYFDITECFGFGKDR